MWWLRWFGYSVLGIAIGAFAVIPFLPAMGRSDEILEGVGVGLAALALSSAILYWTRKVD